MKTFTQFLIEAASRAEKLAKLRNSNRAALKKAGVKGIARGKRGKITQKVDSDGTPNEVKTELTTYQNQTRAIAAQMGPKVDPDTNRVIRTRVRSLAAKHAARQIGNPRKKQNPVTGIHITPNDNNSDNDLPLSDKKARVNNLKKAVKDAPAKVNAEPGHIIIAKPGDTFKGHDTSTEAGVNSRARLFSKIHPELGPLNKKTGIMKTTVRK